MNINKTRSFLYSLARLLGDFNAIKKGRVKERVFNKIIGRLLSKLFR